MSSGPIKVLALASDANAVTKWRDLIGPTNPQKALEAAPQSLRALYGSDVTRNAVHGSDSVFSALRELAFFFPGSLASSLGRVLRCMLVCNVYLSVVSFRLAAPSLKDNYIDRSSYQRHPHS